MGVNDAEYNAMKGRWLQTAVIFVMLLSAPATADDDIAEALGLPGTRHLAAALSDPDSRVETLLTLAAVQNLMDYGRYARRHETTQYVERFRAERAWLDRLADRYADVPMRSSLFDPAAWLLLLELDQHDLSPGPAVSPFGPRTESLLGQLFDRSAERSAATVLPEVLSRMESASTLLWQNVLRSAEENMALASILRGLDDEWFDNWFAAEPPAPAGQGESDGAVEGALSLLETYADTAQRAGPPDALDLKRLRFGLLEAMPELGWEESADAAYLLALASAVDDLYRGRYLAFTESVLWVAAGLLASEIPRADPAPVETQTGPFPPPPVIELERLPGEPEPPVPYESPMADALADLLPALNAVFADGFDAVDPRLNTGLASAFDVVQYIRSGEGNPDQLASLRFGIADSVAQFVLLIPDMDYYLSQPVRGDIAVEINVCISQAASRDESGSSMLGRDEFDDCLHNLARMASTGINSAELAGDPDGPFGPEQLRRELMLPPWQRINFVLGYLLQNQAAGCTAPDEELPNPLEWSGLVTVLTWFARQSPVYFRAPENEILVSGLRQQGRDMLDVLARQVDCISGSGTGINDPVVRTLAGYETALGDLLAETREAELAFRAERLKPGSDLVLGGGPGQRSTFRPEGLSVGPCDERSICEMTALLEAGPSLVGLFPDPYLVADQAGMGSIEICYDNLQWIDRRSEPVREDDPHVANYFGRFSFDLFGRFHEGDETTNVFGFSFISPDEYHYLFGAAGDDVLNDRCPMDRVGERIVTGLGNGRAVRVVPDRLTYLSAARTLPSVVMGTNWMRNQRWHDAFVTGQGAKSHELEADPSFAERLERHLDGLYRAQQAAVYNALLNPPPRGWRGDRDSLNTSLKDLTAHKALVRANVNLFYPLFMVDSDGIRGALEGGDSLLDEVVLRRFRRENVSLGSVAAAGRARFEALQAYWDRQPESVRRTGTIATGLVHAIIRLDALYRDFFAPEPPDPPKPVRGEDALKFEELSG